MVLYFNRILILHINITSSRLLCSCSVYTVLLLRFLGFKAIHCGLLWSIQFSSMQFNSVQFSSLLQGMVCAYLRLFHCIKGRRPHDLCLSQFSSVQFASQCSLVHHSTPNSNTLQVGFARHVQVHSPRLASCRSGLHVMCRFIHFPQLARAGRVCITVQVIISPS